MCRDDSGRYGKASGRDIHAEEGMDGSGPSAFVSPSDSLESDTFGQTLIITDAILI